MVLGEWVGRGDVVEGVWGEKRRQGEVLPLIVDRPVVLLLLLQGLQQGEVVLVRQEGEVTEGQHHREEEEALARRGRQVSLLVVSSETNQERTKKICSLKSGLIK